MDEIAKKASEFSQEIIKGKEQGMYSFEPAFESAQSGKAILAGKDVVMLTSNNYLGLAEHPKIKRAIQDAVETYGSGTCGARLHNGTTVLHEKLEQKCAEFFGTESAVIFSAGYLANVAAISAICDRETLLITDQLNHMSITDGIQLSEAQVRIFKHNDMEKLEYILKKSDNWRKKLIVVEGVYSMEGDLALLDQICSLAEKYHAMVYVDEAHSFGFMGENYQGASEIFGVSDRVQLKMTTFSKSLAGVGGCIATDKNMALYIKHTAHPYIFNASLPPGVVAGVIEGLDLIQSETWRQEKLWKNTILFRKGLMAMGIDTMGGTSPIVPIYIGDDQLNMKITKALLEEGIYIATAIYPAVPKNKSRLRATITATLDKETINFALSKMEQIFKKYNLI